MRSLQDAFGWGLYPVYAAHWHKKKHKQLHGMHCLLTARCRAFEGPHSSSLVLVCACLNGHGQLLS